MKISLAKALKLKNRLAGRLLKVQEDIVKFNSRIKEQTCSVSISSLVEERKHIVDRLIDLKNKLYVKNVEISEKLLTQSELKSTIVFLNSIPTKEGVERHSYQNTEIVYVADFKKLDIDDMVKQAENEIDKLQDEIDAFNHTTFIDVMD